MNCFLFKQNIAHFILEFFRELLKVSRKGFHDMFVRTYGQLYEQNSFLFTAMFDDLEKYYITGGVDLEDAMDDFFHRLYGKMFEVILKYFISYKYYILSRVLFIVLTYLRFISINLSTA